MKANLTSELNNHGPSSVVKVLYVRLPCNPIFPIGPIYLADYVHKCFPEIQQLIVDLASLPILDVERILINSIKNFKPTLLVFSWRDIQIYAPVDGRGGNPLQNSFEVFYARNPFKKIRGALGGFQLMKSHYGEIWRNQRLIRKGLKYAKKFKPNSIAMLGGGAVSVFYNQLKKSLPKGTIISLGEGELLIEKLIRDESIDDERCFVVGESPREKLIHEKPNNIIKTACN